MFERGSVTIARVQGVPIRAHWTLLLVVPYLALVFTLQLDDVARLAGVPPDAIRGAPFLWGMVMAVSLFASITVHELAHALVAMRRGAQVHDVTLMLLGGVSHFSRMPRRPGPSATTATRQTDDRPAPSTRDWVGEALVAIAGPATSLGLAALLLVALRGVPLDAAGTRLVLFYVGSLNAVLGIFNLLPAFPMDGGRVLRAVLASRMSTRKATDIAATIGTVIAVALGAWGVLSGNLLLVLVAVFVGSGAQVEARGERAREALAGLRVADVLLVPATTVPAYTPIVDTLSTMHRAGRLELVVVDERGAALGIVRAGHLASVEPGERNLRTVGELGDRLREGIVEVAWSEPAAAALEAIAEAGADRLLVVDPAGPGGRAPVGVIGPREIEDALALRVLEDSWRSRRGAPPRPVPG